MSLTSPSNRRLAMITFAASEGWATSQKTYLERSLQTFDWGMQGIKPPNLPAMWQHEESEFSKPVAHGDKLIGYKGQSTILANSEYKTDAP